MTPLKPLTRSPQSAVRRRGLLVYLVLAYLGMWAAMAPLLADGYQRADAREGVGVREQLCIGAAMFAPTLAALFVVRFVERAGGGGGVREALALRLPRTRAVRACLLPLGVLGALTAAALVLGALVGSYPFAGFGSLDPGRIGSWAVQGAIGMALSLPLFFGEEIGWQGFLFPRLLRLGRGADGVNDGTGGAAGDGADGGTARLVLAYLLTGTAFALWHLPTLLMGGQYPGRPWYLAVPALTVSCVLVLPVFTWLRLRSGSVVPAVLAHTFTSSMSVSMVREFADPGAELDPLTMSLAGWPGWIVLGGFVAFLAFTGRLRPGRYGGGAG
ncbi:CPBP family intramembrane glutamic endopeptidase [Streptomyces sp. CBMA156]|uniref:CPBP family intramembrane glutamic endopeptidase n=1 Tax=Streptomyces sp. CBMA156 TaxID=1930280 RepID=UPI001CB80479|nr:CPBP family intramembrane glutamic endopeptidase [Streptomyces sp. CBMA156]